MGAHQCVSVRACVCACVGVRMRLGVFGGLQGATTLPAALDALCPVPTFGVRTYECKSGEMCFSQCEQLSRGSVPDPESRSLPHRGRRAPRNALGLGQW